MRVDLRSIAQAASFDPKNALIDRAGDLGQYEIFHNFVLVATYVPPIKKMKGPKGEVVEFHLSDKSHMEDRFQGKVGLVLKCGPLAFVDDASVRFGGMVIEPGDWVMYRPSDGMEMFIKDHLAESSNTGLACRLIEDSLIKARVFDPSLIY